MSTITPFRVRSGWRPGRRRWLILSGAVVVAIAVAAAVAVAKPEWVESARCFAFGEIKGNFNGVERIYHAPGQRYYRETGVSWLRFERRFCTEAAARAAGWRRSRA